jgi:hypothetical protein
MNRRALSITLAALLLNGCVSYALVQPGSSVAGGLSLTVSEKWNKVPAEHTPWARKESTTWTQNGLLLDRLLIIPGIPDGETLFKQRTGAALPKFRADMLPNEIEEFTEASIVKLLGEGKSAITTSKLRPYRFGSNRGILFEVEGAISEGPDYRGLVGAFVYQQHLYMLIYLAAEPYYFDKLYPDAARIILSASPVQTS